MNAFELALAVIAIVIGAIAFVSLIINFVLMMRYIKYNKTSNSSGLTGEQAARKILDLNGLNNIGVSVTGSFLFGNSYSHFFKVVRLRRLTRHKTSVAALAMASQKTALAVLDSENDKDMKVRNKIVPIVYLGPVGLVPMIVVGALLDFVMLKLGGVLMLVCCIVALAFYLFAFILTLYNLKTEKKAQKKAYELVKEYDMATEDEIDDMKTLFKLYNIQYVTDMILAAFEFIYYALKFIAIISGKGDNK